MCRLPRAGNQGSTSAHPKERAAQAASRITWAQEIPLQHKDPAYTALVDAPCTRSCREDNRRSGPLRDRRRLPAAVLDVARAYDCSHTATTDRLLYSRPNAVPDEEPRHSGRTGCLDLVPG